ncbi:MAG: chorismate-binding protein, partial [Crenarchaeota archaeon]|nr:chorismate-binding protein [Thermoproteota archaeon]NPA05010.1 chorismate-binding protein [Thermoproteota archaeon]
MPCEKPVKVRDPTTGKEVELVPIKVWVLAPKGRKGVKIGLFKSPETGKYF